MTGSEEGLKLFIEISKVLLGRSQLSEPLARIYWDMLTEMDCAGPLDKLKALLVKNSEGPKETLDERLAQALKSSKPSEPTDVQLLAQRILCLWYTSILYEDPGATNAVTCDPEMHARNPQQCCNKRGQKWSRPGPPEAYFQAFMWEAASTHPMGVTGPFYGEWAYPPQQPAPSRKNQ